MPVRFVPERDLTKTAAVASETRTELDRAQSLIASRAQGNLASVHDQGRHHVTTSRGSVDRFVSLEGPAALAVETGHHTKTGTLVPGHGILKSAIG